MSRKDTLSRAKLETETHPVGPHPLLQLSPEPMDLILLSTNSRQAILTQGTIPNNKNLRDAHNEKIAEYRDLETQIMKLFFECLLHTIGTQNKIYTTYKLQIRKFYYGYFLLNHLFINI